MNAGTVYVVVAEDGKVKVGHSSNLRRRYAQLKSTKQSYRPDPDAAIALGDAFRFERDEAALVEIRAHHILKEQNYNGDWFTVDLATATSAIFQAARELGFEFTKETKLPLMRGRPFGATYETEARIRLTDEQIQRLDAWASAQPDTPNRSEAIRRLIERGLA